MLSIINTVILGIVEGITEFLPISSTGHLMLSSLLLKLPKTEFLKSFEIIIQLGAILAVVVLYWKKLWQWEMIKKLAVAFVPTGIIGLILYKIIKQYFLNSTTIVLWSLFLGGLFLVVFERFYKEKNVANEALEKISYCDCLLLGLFQSLAMIPGVSRSAATIIGGLILGYKRKQIVEFSFLLAVPTMLAATGLDLIKNFNSFSGDQLNSLVVGFIISFVVAIIAIKWLLGFIQNHTFIWFGVYRMAVAVAFFLIIK
jgi:undecaprenyl-diphosphatase